MAVQLTLTDEQARWLSEYLGARIDDWHWNAHQRPDSDAQEHAHTIKNKIDERRSAGSWDGPGGR